MGSPMTVARAARAIAAAAACIAARLPAAAMLAAALSGTAMLASCSLSYREEQSAQLPQEAQFTFRNAVFMRYEDNACTLRLTASRIEQYKDSDTAYIKDAEFQSWDAAPGSSAKQASLSGRCKLLVADTFSNSFSMFNAIEIRGGDDELMQAQALKWSSGSGQLVSGSDADVHIERGGISVTGGGFSADSNTGDFVFSKSVSGSIEAGDEEGA
ncbi:MAG TPA: LPS export ABC transporter periplasmic protein LptC [Treponema sp.]|nr:LPS export ABC transporter periplasmic protein LptC [Treponema sp.]